MNKTNEIFVFGHKNPDTDAVTSAIALSYLKQQFYDFLKYIDNQFQNFFHQWLE